jgi:hypothetical protein
MNMSETPEKKKARLRYDNVFKTAWTDEFHFIKHSQKGNKIAFCKFCRTDFSIKHRGHSDVTKHVGTAKHKGNAKDAQSSKMQQNAPFCVLLKKKNHFIILYLKF